MTTSTTFKKLSYSYTTHTKCPGFKAISSTTEDYSKIENGLMVANDELVVASISNHVFQKLTTWQGTPDHIAQMVDDFLKSATNGTYNISVMSVGGYKKKLQITIE